MWYEIIPPMVIMTALLVLPDVVGTQFNKFVLGNAYRRELLSEFDRYAFMRDARIDGAPWNVRGLEKIPDEP